MAIKVSDSGYGSWGASDGVITGKKYRLRAGAPMPTESDGFVLHTFGADLSDVEVHFCTTSLPGSDEFRGQSGKEDAYISANFSRLNIKGGNTFQGKIVKNLSWIEEGSVFTYG